jgi:ABC-type lipoprotein export system ATPase subunit
VRSRDYPGERIALIVLKDVTKTYIAGRAEVAALNSVTLQVERGEFVAVRGPSGSGKTTLLMTIAAMLQPTRGSITVDGHDLHVMDARRKAAFRARTIGFVFQMFHLVPYLNVIENVALAAGAIRQGDARAKASDLLRQLGMEGRSLHMPSELSAGERQRTAIARALLNHPKILLADEPTGNLDPENTAAVLSYLSNFQRKGGTVIVATHEPEAELLADRIVSLRGGSVV